MGRASPALNENSQKLGVIFFLYVFWLATLPFAPFSVVETYSVDNLLAPFLLLVALFRPRYVYRDFVATRNRRLLIVIAIFLFYSLTQLIAIVNARDILGIKAWASLRTSFYFLVPLIFVRDFRSLKWTKTMFFWIAIAACLSALLASLGIIELEAQRFETSRLGLDWFPKAIGLFTSYGDVAIIFAFVGSCIVAQKRIDLYFGLGTRTMKMLILVVLALGLLGTQSRNILFSLIISMLVAAYFKPLRRSNFATVGLLLAGFIAVTGVVVTFSGSIVSGISGVGGQVAQETVTVRLESFGAAAELWLKSLIIGLGPDLYRQHQPLVDGLHNMWLKVGLRGGLLGVLSMMTLILFAIIGAVKGLAHPKASRDARGILAVVIVIVFATQFYGGLTDIFWVAMGASLGFWASSWDRWPDADDAR